MSKEERGFASMDSAKQREIASKGGRAAHQKGTAHEWTREEAREAGRRRGWLGRQCLGVRPVFLSDGPPVGAPEVGPVTPRAALPEAVRETVRA